MKEASDIFVIWHTLQFYLIGEWEAEYRGKDGMRELDIYRVSMIC